MTETLSYKAISIPATANPSGINDSALIVGTYFNTQTFTTSAFTFTTSLKTLSGPSGASFTATAVNDGGEILGYVGDSTSTSYLDEGGTFNVLSGPTGATSVQAMSLSNNGNVAGNYTKSGGGQAGYVDIGGTFTTLTGPTGATSVNVVGVNNSGMVVGYYKTSTSGNNFIGFTYDAGTYASLAGPTGATSVTIAGINDSGQIIGTYTTSQNTVGEGFIYQNGTYTTVTGPSGATSTSLVAINDKGQLVGWAETSKSVAFIATPPVVKKTGPVITAVSATPTTGHTIDGDTTVVIDVTFNDTPLLLSGTPTMKLGSYAATYDSVNSDLNTGVLVFDYTVGKGQSSKDLKVTSIALSKGGKLTDLEGDAASFKMTPTEENLGLVVDGTPPTVKSARATSTAKTIVNGDTVTITLTMSEAVTVQGTPSLALSDLATATYVSGSGGKTLTFAYHVGSETSADLTITGINQSAGNAITDIAGNPLSSTYAANLRLKINGGGAGVRPANADPALFVNAIAGFAPAGGHGDVAVAAAAVAENHSHVLAQPHA